MRLSKLAVLGLALVAFPSMAHAGVRIVAGSHTCAQKVPCQDDGNFSPEQWASVGNACIREGFGLSNPNGIIDDNAGLDGANRLTTKPDSVAKGPGALLLPECSDVSLQDGSCVIHCELVQQ
jgi:hypothetical protein